MMNCKARDRIDLTHDGERFVAPLLEGAADAILRDCGGVDICVDADSMYLYAASALVISGRLAQLDPAAPNSHPETQRNRVDSRGRWNGWSGCTGQGDVETAVARTGKRKLDPAHLDIGQSETVTAAGKKIAQRVADRDALRLQERLRATFDANLAQRRAVAADVNLDDANVVSSERGAGPNGNTQQLVARSRHEPDDDRGGQQADCKALAHVSPLASIPFELLRTPPT